ncbi:MAG: WbqC family protein [Bacteroidia bacterium]
MRTVLSLNYLPNILWMRHFLTNNAVIDTHEHFVKQTYRNRTIILSANGPLALTIPIQKMAHKMPMKDLKADNTKHWQRQHWESIKSAYGSAPYFIHYADAFEKLYQSAPETLLQFEIDLLTLCLKLLKIDAKIHLSETYVMPESDDTDLRKIITPKIETKENFKPYLQVFAEKFPFTPNLSVIDVLFNYGPRSIDYILD